jgi:hypothetical protein
LEKRKKTFHPLAFPLFILSFLCVSLYLTTVASLMTHSGPLCWRVGDLAASHYRRCYTLEDDSTARSNTQEERLWLNVANLKSKTDANGLLLPGWSVLFQVAAHKKEKTEPPQIKKKIPKHKRERETRTRRRPKRLCGNG